MKMMKMMMLMMMTDALSDITSKVDLNSRLHGNWLSSSHVTESRPTRHCDVSHRLPVSTPLTTRLLSDLIKACTAPLLYHFT